MLSAAIIVLGTIMPSTTLAKRLMTNFLNGAITLTKLSEAMQLGKLGLQFMLKSKQAFDRIVFEEAIPAAASEWYPLKKGRDDEARRSYRDIRGRRERNGLYITRILEEEITADDMRI